MGAQREYTWVYGSVHSLARSLPGPQWCLARSGALPADALRVGPRLAVMES